MNEQFFKKKITATAAVSPVTQTDVQFLETVESEDKTSNATQTEEELFEEIVNVANVTQSTQTTGK